ncbi:MAG: hypothetical protein R2764_19805 [Bacteroidales bacterium]
MGSRHTHHINLKPVWLKAAVLGGLWASVEIIIGSFFHNLRLPFAGTILAANATVLMIAFYQMWPEKGLIWRAGLIAALMKSISPSAIILGPMIGIMAEALIIELFIRFFGNNLVSLSIAGALSVSSALIHKVVSLLILYGFNIVKIYVNMFHYFAKQVRIENADPWALLFLVIGVYLVLGIVSAFMGIRVGRTSVSKVLEKRGFVTEQNFSNNILTTNPNQNFSLVFFFAHILLIPLGLFVLHQFSLFYSTLFVLVYAAVCIFRYRNSLRRLKKPFFWFQLFVLTFLAAMFWNGFNSEGSLFDIEGLLIGFEMNIRAVFVVIAFSSFGVELRNPVIRDFLFKKGFDKIYSAMGLSFSALPAMIDAMPRPQVFLRHPIESFSNMMIHAKEWLGVFEDSK